MKLRLRPKGLAAALLAAAMAVGASAPAQNTKRLVLQGFWWDFKNNNYPQGWANYLADLAPRLRQAGIQAVWVPPNVKNANPASVGYSPFDHYDLGDKYQKSNLKTPFGDKDEFLRMVAVLHANGIEVVEDVVLNHMDGAGSGTGQGAIDPAYTTFYRSVSTLPTNDPTSGYKTFRYPCFAQAIGDETAAEYLSRPGRFPKNWQNFFPNPSDSRITGEDGSQTTFGPDIGYNDGSYGQASSAGYNPTQASRYMRDNMRAWCIWMKKQTGIDGWRLDAVKHFPAYAAEDFLWNTQYNAGWASATENMLAVGEWVGSKSEIDTWTDNVQGRAGTFDFSLRGFSGTPGLYGLVYGNGGYDLSNLPGLQQDRRFRTFPFLNSHDTFRPSLLANGNYPTSANWGGGSELAPHVDPREPRVAAAYAVTLAVDGNPVVFIEDLFDLGTTGKRYTHLPTNVTDLPTRAEIANLTACHSKLGFKQGAYMVPYQSADYLIIERSGKAIIGVTDNWNTWQAQYVTTQFPAGTRLIDYGGSSPATDVRVVGTDRRVQISTPPCNGTALRRGYSVWAPEGQDLGTINPTAIPTTQEWEMADDLGDSHPRSLGQGGALPANSRAIRYAGKIYPEAGRAVTVNLFLADTTKAVTLLVLNGCQQPIDSVTGVGNKTLTYTPTATGWIQLAVRQGSANSPSQKCWIKASYTAPKVIDALNNKSYLPTQVDLGDDRALCRFTGTLSAFTGTGFTYRWTDSTGTTVGSNQTLAPPYPGVFTVLKTNTSSGCTATASVRVTALIDLPTQPVIRQSNDTLYIDGQPGVTYQWLLGGNPISGATGTFYKAGTGAGSYIVRATNTSNCSIVSRPFAYTLSVSKQIEAGIELAPNPTSGLASLRLTGMAAQAVQMSLIGADGRRIPVSLKASTLDLTALADGLYVLEVATPLGVGRKRLVKE